MKVLCILQNQWFKNPEKAQRIIDNLITKCGEEGRRDFLTGTLFMGCLTGRRIRAVFGEFLEDFTFEEASRQIGGYSASQFPADPKHITAAINEVKPDCVIALGTIAANGVLAAMRHPEIRQSFHFLPGPHPAARGADTIPRLEVVASQLRNLYARHS